MTTATATVRTPAPMDFDPRLLRTAFARFPSGVAAICALVDGVPVGMAVSSFTSISLEPALVAIAIAQTSTTWPRLAAAPELGISVLAHTHGELCRTLASSPADRFGDAPWRATADGAVHIDDAALAMTATIDSVVSAGDHSIVILALRSVQRSADIAPLVFHDSRFRSLQP